jgi:hypothetical protein
MLHCAGWFGLLFYALASGLPILLQGFLGPVVQKRKPNLLSFTDFVQQVSYAGCLSPFLSFSVQHILVLSRGHSIMPNLLDVRFNFGLLSSTAAYHHAQTGFSKVHAHMLGWAQDIHIYLHQACQLCMLLTVHMPACSAMGRPFRCGLAFSWCSTWA